MQFSVLGRFSDYFFLKRKVAKCWRWYSFLCERIHCNVTCCFLFFNWTSTILSIRGILFLFDNLVDNLVRAFLEIVCMKGRSRTIVFISLFVFSYSWTESSKTVTVLVLRNSFPMSSCIEIAVMNVWPFSRYLTITVSDPHVFTLCGRPMSKYQFLCWPLQLSIYSQMWS